MARSHNVKRNRIAFARTSRQNQGPCNAFNSCEQEIIAEQKAAREREALRLRLSKDAPTREKEKHDTQRATAQGASKETPCGAGPAHHPTAGA